MSDTHVALKDANSVASAIFESSTSSGVILRGQIDQITGRILVDVVGAAAGNLQKETPTGTINGINTIFTTANNPVLVILNGAVQDSGVDYVVTGSYTITFTYAPPTNSLLFTIYGSGSTGGTGSWYPVSGTINGVNTTFTIPVTPGSDFMLVLGGQTQMKNVYYTVSGNTITYQPSYIPT